MDNSQRIDKIEEFVHLQRYVHGLRFRVDEDPELEDHFIITFETASQRQILTMAHRLKLAGMVHIRVTAKKVIEYEKSKKHKRR
jgi:hypothetical protein